MTVYRVTLAFDEVFAAPQTCPGCGAAGLVAVVVDDRTAFRCAECRRAWVIETGRIEPDDPPELADPVESVESADPTELVADAPR